ncbi:hypothetical protein HPP92_021773 [Vanilla planifolia]|uniref:Uncharacterized protein n=1 Tax=Vanilla planifolia TaxID=51239 RepID=A0A835PR15_VANPL|nr:hypothetical protein HPP92_021773 [Vanilla planifolia]
MGSRVPVTHSYTLRPASSFISGSLHDLNTVESRNGEIDGISGVDRDDVTDDSLDNDDESTSVDCIDESYRNSLPLHGVEVEEEQSALENAGRLSSPSFSILTVDDVSPIETARVRFLQIIVDHFIKENVIEVAGLFNVEYGHGHDKQKRKLHEVHWIREKTIGVALEAAGGLYRKLAKRFPRKGPCSFKRRELATSLETRTRFPELVVQEEKRVRFVVVNGLMIVEKPNNMPLEDAEWFKRLTGRHEVSISARDYKFYSPRHKYRRVQSQSVSNIAIGTFSGTDSSPTLTNVAGFRPSIEQIPHHPSAKHYMQHLQQQTQYHSIPQGHHQTVQNQQPTHFPHMHQCTHSSHVTDIAHQSLPPAMPQHVPCLQSLPGALVGSRLHLLPTSPAKFCDECGAPYVRETSKFCSECGTKRLGT